MRTPFHSFSLLILCLVVPLPAEAERTDRDKPIHLEADRMSIDDLKKVQILEGNVVLTQGSLEIRTQRLVVTQDANGFQKGTATGGPNGLVRFKQKRDGSNSIIEGEAERIEHDARTEKTDFYNRARIKSGLDEVKGQFISYDAVNEKYLVSNTGPSLKSGTGESSSRVRAIIQPKNREQSPPISKGEPLQLRPAQSVVPRTE
ncbi:MAG: lipopolysaccharide transport periplasmic protein LptA [Candidatus Accumulibacter sp.]|nr:lipopolysaccharide transport periplasmic protein LptA [Accumulibacter sp.]